MSENDDDFVSYVRYSPCSDTSYCTSSLLQGSIMALKRRRATSPSSSVSGGDFDDSQTSSLVSSIGRKRRRTSNIPTVDPVILTVTALFIYCQNYTITQSDWVDDIGRSFFACRLLFVMNCTTQSEISRMTKAGCCVSCSSEPLNEGEEKDCLALFTWELLHPEIYFISIK